MARPHVGAHSNCRRVCRTTLTSNSGDAVTRSTRFANLLYPIMFQLLATVAQLAEQRFCKPQVIGSSPIGGSNKVNYQARTFRCFMLHEPYKLGA